MGPAGETDLGEHPARVRESTRWRRAAEGRAEGHAQPPARSEHLRVGWKPPTLSQRFLAKGSRSALLFLAEQAADRGLDALLLGGFVQRVLAAVATAGVARGAVLRACRALGTENDL